MRLGRSIGGASPLELTWLTVAEAAHALAVSENTVKTDLPNIFAKTRSARQTQLMKVVNDLRSPLRQIQRAQRLQRQRNGQGPEPVLPMPFYRGEL